MSEDLAHRRLTDLKVELLALMAVSEGSRRPVELDQQSVGRLSRMDAMQQQAMAQAHQRNRQREIDRIDAALRRLSDGEYGACLRCGEDIEPARLERDPAVPLCSRCASGARDE